MPENIPRRMQGIVSFEEADRGWHAHMLVKPPAGAEPTHFAEAASHVWTEQPTPSSIYRGTPPSRAVREDPRPGRDRHLQGQTSGRP
jgi:hypothetical protein